MKAAVAPTRKTATVGERVTVKNLEEILKASELRSRGPSVSFVAEHGEQAGALTLFPKQGGELAPKVFGNDERVRVHVRVSKWLI